MAIWEKFRWAIGLHSQEVGELSAVHRKNAGAGEDAASLSGLSLLANHGKRPES